MTGQAAASLPNGRSSPDEPSPYRCAITDTIATVQRRVRLYRVVAATTLLIPVAATVTALTTRSAASLAIVLALVPGFGLFRCADLWILARWEHRIVALWQYRDLDFASFRTAMEATRSLPRNTLAGMLDLLPLDAALRGAATMPAEFRAAVASTMRVIVRTDSIANGLRTLGRCALVTGMGLSLAFRLWRPVMLLAVSGLTLEVVGWQLPRIASAMWRRKLKPDAHTGQFVATARTLNWRALPRPTLHERQEKKHVDEKG